MRKNIVLYLFVWLTFLTVYAHSSPTCDVPLSCNSGEIEIFDPEEYIGHYKLLAVYGEPTTDYDCTSTLHTKIFYKDIHIVNDDYEADTYKIKSYCGLNPCDDGQIPNELGECSCPTGALINPITAMCDYPPVCELDHENFDVSSWTCKCDSNSTRSVFSGQCIPICGDGTDDQDCDNIPNDQDPDIDGDGIPNDQDPDIDGDGIPNAEDSTPSGGSGDGGSDTPPITDDCTAIDTNSYTSSDGSCQCFSNYHKEDGFCVSNNPIYHDPKCDYPATKDGYSFQDLTFTIGSCQYSINFFNGGTYAKLDTCDYYGCYYNEDGSGDGNGTSPNDLDGDGIPDDQDPDKNGDGLIDGNSTSDGGLSDGGLFDKASSALNNLNGKTVDLKVSGGSIQPVVLNMYGKSYVLFDPSFIPPDVWQTMRLVFKWIAIVSGLITVFMTI